MSTTKYISIAEAAELSGKSVQTIRRMIKAKKIRYRKDKTPQGFNYLIELDALLEFYSISEDAVRDTLSAIDSQQQEDVAELKTVQAKDEDYAEQVETKEVATLERSHQKIVSYEPVKEFNDTMQKLIEQHGKEKENLFKLIENFQNKVISLETKLKVESSAKKSWFKIW